jgi:hypothetical protein
VLAGTVPLTVRIILGIKGISTIGHGKDWAKTKRTKRFTGSWFIRISLALVVTRSDSETTNSPPNSQDRGRQQGERDDVVAVYTVLCPVQA